MAVDVSVDEDPNRTGVICGADGNPVRFMLQSVQAFQETRWVLGDGWNPDYHKEYTTKYVGVFTTGSSDHIFEGYREHGSGIKWKSCEIPHTYLRPYNKDI
jgi:hypothetical protein